MFSMNSEISHGSSLGHALIQHTSQSPKGPRTEIIGF